MAQQFNPYAAPETRQPQGSRPPMAPGKETAIVNGARLRRMRTPMERFIGFALLFGSVLGNVLAFNNGQLMPIAFTALGLGIGAQVLLTLIQWVYKPHGRGLIAHIKTLKWQYLASVAAGTGLSIVGYATVLHDPALRVFAPMPRLQFAMAGIPGPVIATWLLITVVSLVIEVIPENILVD
jgi:hypothetical protein